MGGQKSLKMNRRALRKTAKKEKNAIITRYMTDNWDKVVVSTVAFIRQFKFKTRLDIAMAIIFKPIKIPKDRPIKDSGASPGKTSPNPKESGVAQA